MQLKNPQNYWGNTKEEEYYKQQNIKSTKSFYTNPITKNTLFTRSWVPISTPTRGIICMVHGFGNDISWTFQSTPIFLAQNGFSCFAMDILGHGQSNGLQGFVPHIDVVVDDCFAFFNSIMELKDHENLPCFLYGESMGGAISLLVSSARKLLKDCKEGSYLIQGEMEEKMSTDSTGKVIEDKRSKPVSIKNLKGAILVAPMCKIDDNLRPKWPIPEILTFIGKFMPKLAIVPTTNILEKSIKVHEKFLVANKNPLRYKGKPRLGTVLELLRVMDDLSLKDVTIPFIVLHGSADQVTDISMSRSLYEKAESKDKTIKIYEGMCHSLVFGETDENVALVRNDILVWLNSRCEF